MNIEKLREAIKDSGITMKALSEKTGIARPTLYNRLDGIGEITVSEMQRLAEAMRLTDEEKEQIFFAEKVT